MHTQEGHPHHTLGGEVRGEELERVLGGRHKIAEELGLGLILGVAHGGTHAVAELQQLLDHMAAHKA